MDYNQYIGMFKRVLLVAILLVCALSQNEGETKLGGYSVVDPGTINSVEEVVELRRIENFAREEFKKTNGNDKLDTLLSVERQVVAGFNYKMTFRSNNGDLYEVVVFDQSWTHTTQLMSVTKKN